MPYTTTFVPAESVTVDTAVPASLLPFNGMALPTFAMPAVDASNPDLQVTNNGPNTAWINFSTGTTGAPVGVQSPGALEVGGSILLTSNEATLAAMASNPQVQSNSIAANAQSVTVATIQHRHTTLTFTRGTATARITWSA